MDTKSSSYLKPSLVLSQNLDYNSQEIVKSVKHNSQNLYTLTTSTKKATFSLYEISKKKDQNLKITLKSSLEIPLGKDLLPQDCYSVDLIKNDVFVTCKDSSSKKIAIKKFTLHKIRKILKEDKSNNALIDIDALEIIETISTFIQEPLQKDQNTYIITAVSGQRASSY